MVGVSINPNRALIAECFEGDRPLITLATPELGLPRRMAAVTTEGDRLSSMVRIRSIRRSSGGAVLSTVVDDRVV